MVQRVRQGDEARIWKGPHAKVSVQFPWKETGSGYR